ncbi:hypothetical protein HAX54_026665 [Datura stramonium]|uniref:Polygalacturonase n=1 Tax=Datura stramonium TaxID=4076 RepID=A0ABS8S811_DATST|nr:hypothetical protein [Datura stramonium]
MVIIRSLLVVLLATSLFSTTCNGKKKIGKPIKHDHMRKKPQTNAIIDIQAFGAKGDGLSDDTQINGEVRASKDISDYKEDRRHWLLFQNMENFIVEGVGSIHGNGQVWWKRSCKVDKTIPCNAKTLTVPTAMSFYNCTNLTVRNLEFKNPQKMHLTITKSVFVEVSRLKITAPADSPNTDGIHVSGTTDIDIHHSYIETGDDCISIVNGSTNVRARYILCGPGHGISIGSLGKNKEEDIVSNIYVHDATLRGTTNGLRIKSWQKEAVHVSNIMYKNIKGTSSTQTAIKLNCSKTVPCKGIQMENVNIRHQGGATVKALCANVKYTTKGVLFPKCPSRRPWAFLWN